jgi:hypothetical protein
MEAPEEMDCGECGERLPIECFGICKARKTGRNLYCKVCILEKVHACRDRKRAMKKARNLAKTHPERKPLVISAPVLPSAMQKVKYAVRDGQHTRWAIREATGLTMDQVGDALAELTFVHKVLRTKPVDNERHFFVREIAA